MNEKNSILVLLTAIKTWGKRVLLTMIIGGLIVAGVSLLMPNYYKAKTVFLPANIGLATPSPLGYGDRDRNPFGGGGELDRLFILSSSLEYKLEIIRKFNLAEKYDIDTSDYEDKLKLIEKFEKHFSLEKNKYEALELSFEDTDRELTAKVANFSRQYLSEKALGIVRSTNANLISSQEKSLQNQEYQAIKLSDSIRRIKENYGIIQTGTQGAELSERLVEAQADYEDASAKVGFYKDKPTYRDSLIKYQAMERGSKNRMVGLMKNSSMYSAKVNELLKLESELNQLINQTALEKEKLKQVQAIQNNDVVTLQVIEEASIPLKKSRPQRAILVLTSMIIIGFVTLLASMFFDSNLFASVKKGL